MAKEFEIYDENQRNNEMNNQEYLEIVEKYPRITSWGYGVNMDWAEGLTREEYFNKEREDLKGQQEKFELCLQWLDENPNLEGKRSAHYLKDRVQNELSPHSHIPRGVFILAALHRGYRVTKMEGSSNAWIEEREEVPA